MKKLGIRINSKKEDGKKISNVVLPGHIVDLDVDTKFKWVDGKKTDEIIAYVTDLKVRIAEEAKEVEHEGVSMGAFAGKVIPVKGLWLNILPERAHMNGQYVQLCRLTENLEEGDEVELGLLEKGDVIGKPVSLLVSSVPTRETKDLPEDMQTFYTLGKRIGAWEGGEILSPEDLIDDPF